MALPKNRAFSLAEVLVAVGLVGMVLSMIAGAIVILDRQVANERLVVLPESKVADADLEGFGYAKYKTDLNPARPNYVLAPSKVEEALAQSLFRQVQDLYAQSYAVAVLNKYIIHNFVASSPYFVGLGGYLSTPSQGNLPRATLIDPDELDSTLTSRFSGVTSGEKYATWAPSALLEDSRAMTIFFLAPRDRILGILRARAFQFTSGSPYRFYEVSLARVVWKDASSASSVESWKLADDNNFVEDTVYRFVEDKNYPQSLIFPPSDLATATSSQNLFFRLASPSEPYTSATSATVSRRQTALVTNSTDEQSPTYEWHVVLPDPSLTQGEDRAKVVRDNGIPTGTVLDRYKLIRRQGRFSCVFKVFP